VTRWPKAHVAAAVLIALVLVVLATSARESRGRAPLHAAYVDAGGLRLRYVRAGRGPTVVLLHGFGESLIAWRGVFGRLVEHSEVIAFDLPGFGLSSKPTLGYETDSLAHDVVRALGALGVQRATLVGHSLGGAVAAAVALDAPAMVTHLVLVDGAVVGAPALVPDAHGSDETVSAARRAIAEYEALRTRFTSPHDPHWITEADSDAAYLPANDPAYRAALDAVLREFDFAYLTQQRAAALRVPTLVLWGEYDPVFPLAMGRTLAATLPNARFEVIPRSWHRPHEERPEETAAAITRFLTREGHQSSPTP
jgi:pimeloyl-ACP methyl ester carboxylesterase